MELCKLENHAVLKLSLIYHSVGAEVRFPNLSLAELTAFLVFVTQARKDVVAAASGLIRRIQPCDRELWLEPQ